TSGVLPHFVRTETHSGRFGKTAQNHQKRQPTLNRPDKFKAPFIPRERIWQETEKLRAAYPAGRIVPVQVLELAEFDLGLELIPAEGLREELEIDALLMGDLKSILVDRRAFMNPRMEYRLRFSVAHEIGHLILHRDIYGRQKHASAREWFDYGKG